MIDVHYANVGNPLVRNCVLIIGVHLSGQFLKLTVFV